MAVTSREFGGAARNIPGNKTAAAVIWGIGCIMTYADFALFVIARDVLTESHSVTATFNGEFVGSVPEGALVECTGEVVKAGRSMVFVRGLITTGAEPVMSFSAVIKKTGPRQKRS